MKILVDFILGAKCCNIMLFKFFKILDSETFLALRQKRFGICMKPLKGLIYNNSFTQLPKLMWSVAFRYSVYFTKFGGAQMCS